MRKVVQLYVLILISIFLCSGCAAPSAEAWFRDSGLADEALPAFEIQYLTLSGTPTAFIERTDDAQGLWERIVSAPIISLPTAYMQYSAQQEASHRILMSVAGKQMALYYDEALGLLTYIQEKQEGEDLIILCQYAQTDEAFNTLLRQSQDLAVVAQPQPQASFDTSRLLLRASISRQELQQEGADVDYSLYDGDFKPELDLPLYTVYTQESYEGLSEDQVLLVMTPGSDAAPYSQIDIDSLQTTEHYIIIKTTLEPPTPGIVREDEPQIPLMMVTCARADLGEDKIVVFLNQRGEILEALQFSPAS